MRTAYRPEIEVAAAANLLEPDLVEAIVLVESAGLTRAYRYESIFWAKYLAGNPAYQNRNPLRVSASYGLMQVMYVVAVECGYDSLDPEHLFVPSIGLLYGCKKLRQLLDWAHGNTLQALAAYNGGKGGNATPPFRNVNYANRVLAQIKKG